MCFFTHSINLGLKAQFVVDHSTKIFVLLHQFNSLISITTGEMAAGSVFSCKSVLEFLHVQTDIKGQS